jgi:hypothetical protein
MSDEQRRLLTVTTVSSIYAGSGIAPDQLMLALLYVDHYLKSGTVVPMVKPSLTVVE